MPLIFRSSRQRFDRYLGHLREHKTRKARRDVVTAEGLVPAGGAAPLPGGGGGGRMGGRRGGALPGASAAASGAELAGPRTALDTPGSPMHRRQARGFGRLMLEFLAFLRGHRLPTALSLATLTISSLVALIPPYGTKLVIDHALGHQPPPHWLTRLPAAVLQPRVLLAAVALTMIALSLVSVLLGVWGRWHMTRVAKRLTVSVRRRLFEHAIALPLHRIHHLRSGGVASILRDDAGAVGEMTFSLLYNPWRALTQLVGCLVILTVTDWRLFLGSILILPIVWLTHRTWIQRIRPIYRDIRATRTTIDASATEAFGGIRVVRGFNRQRREAGRFTADNHLMARQELLAWWWSRGVDIAWGILIPIATAALLWYGGYRILSDESALAAGRLQPGDQLTVGELVMFLVYLGWLLGPIAALAGTAAQLQNNLAAMDRTLDLLAEHPEMPDREGAQRLHRPAVAGRIEFRHVDFTYPGNDQPTLHDISFTAHPGQTVALVGRSGAGKTTLCNLVARFHDPDAAPAPGGNGVPGPGGAVLLDGVDLRDIQLGQYRGLLGIVEQDVFVFDGTIAANIAYGRRDATPQQIEEAARRANAHEFISSLPQKYDTVIGERGVKLSGGQRQRLCIARAILADPRILILDEATSNLDTQSEQLIQAALAELFVDRTTFVIAHRLSTVQHADQIIVLDAGRIVEMGTHAELMARPEGVYRDMVERQRAFADETLPA